MSRSPSSRATMDDVAARAGVSQMTVSRVLNKKGYTSPEVRERVKVAARELGYVQNRLAWSLRSDSSSLVTAVLPTLNNRVFSEVLSGINDAAGRLGCQVAFAVSEYEPVREEVLVQDFLAWRPRGIILAGLEHNTGTVAALTASDIPVVEIMDIEGTPIGASVGLGQRESGREMARHLLARGFRRLAYIGSQGGLDLRAVKRLDGFLETVREAGAQTVCVEVSESPSSMLEGRRMTREILAGPNPPDAIYYSNDDLAAGGLMHCLAEGIAVPEGVALAGFNGLPFLEALPLRLTTTETPRYEIGQRAVELLSLDSATTRGRVVDLGFRLVPGDTT